MSEDLPDSTDKKRPVSEKEEKRLREEYGLDNPPANSLSTAASAGVEFAGVVIVAVAIGWWLDRRFNSSPVLLLLLALVSMAGGLYRMIRKVLREGSKA